MLTATLAVLPRIWFAWRLTSPPLTNIASVAPGSSAVILFPTMDPDPLRRVTAMPATGAFTLWNRIVLSRTVTELACVV